MIKTDQYRKSGCDNLILTSKKPFDVAKSQTISRWIKETLQECGVDINIYTAHSTRHAATSAAYRKGVSVETIKKAAGWTERSSAFAKFYNKPLAKPVNEFASGIFSKN